MSKHTPGPWAVTKRIVHKASGGWVADCNGHSEADCDQCDANARLIAAAPEMYQILRDMIDIGPGPTGLLRKCVEQILAKAEGKR